MKYFSAVSAHRIQEQFLKRKRRLFFLFFSIVAELFCCFTPLTHFSQSLQNGFDGASEAIQPNYQTDQSRKRNYKKQQELISRFSRFGNLSTGDSYSVALCADVPDNHRPYKPYYKSACGHVFITLTKISASNDTINASFGFYPLHADFSIFNFKVKSKIGDNNEREFDVKIEKKLTALEFTTVLETAVRSCIRKYHLKKYNCYDYGLEVFNTVMKEKLLTHHIRLPLWIGRGGSPCGLYKDLEKMKQDNKPNEAMIRFGSFKSPKANSH